eukprot:PhM_4_TR285/c0_g1_i1/m.80485/K15117/SLC25A34_35, OAC1; solute carrier family 25, member 34/35
MSNNGTATGSSTTRDQAIRFCLGAVASCGAVTVSNPAEVVKTRMQLQGQLQSMSSPDTVRYRNALHGFTEIFRTEGLRGVQRGLGAAYVYQIALNGTRLGTYDTLKALLHDPAFESHQSTLSKVGCAALAGGLGAFAGSPFFLVKTRMQSASTPEYAAYSGVWDGLRKVYRAGGVRGLYQGSWPAIVRTIVGSSTQLPTYDLLKNALVTSSLTSSYFGAKDTHTHITTAVMASFVVTFCMNPFDVIMTRNYNSGSGTSSPQYHGISDTFVRMARTEGVQGFYKGFWAHFARLGPHFVCTFTFYEFLKHQAEKRKWL